jgi:hypothetical protein
MSLIALQSYSLNESLEILLKKRIYFPQRYWLKGWILAFISSILVSLIFHMELAIGIGISCIYFFRSTIEFHFLGIIKTQKRWFPLKTQTSVKNYSKLIKRFILFLLQLLILFAIAKLVTPHNQSIFLMSFFILIFCHRIQSRPFRAIQIDLYRYYVKNALSWVELRIHQLILLNIILVTLLFIWLSQTNIFSTTMVPIYLIFMTSGFALALASVGKEIGLFHWIFPIKITELATLLLIPPPFKTPLLFLTISLELIIYVFIFYYKSKFLRFYLMGPDKRDHLSLTETLTNLKKSPGNLLMVSLSTKSYSFKDQKLIALKPFRLSPTKWLIPNSTPEHAYELWKNFPRLIRKIQEIKANEIIAYLEKNEKLIELDINYLPSFINKSNKWLDPKGLPPSPAMLKEFYGIEAQIRNNHFFSDMKYCYHFNGKFIYPMVELDKFNQIIVIDSYDQKLIDFLKAKNWQALRSFLSSSS